jgi:hypothetical protein
MSIADLNTGANAPGANGSTPAAARQTIANPPAPPSPSPPVFDGSGTKASAVGDIPGVGTISFPIAGGGTQDIGGGLGEPRSHGTHQGCDIFAAYGAPVVAVTSGEVVKIGENSLGGMRVSVQDSQGNIHYYAHLSGYANGLALGQTVTSGQLVGYVGTSGNAQGTSPHLHYSINEGSKTKQLVDPVALFKNNQWVSVDPSTVGDGIPQYSGDITGTTDPLSNLTDEDALDIVRADLPFMLGFMEIPELRDIFVQAAREGRSTDQGWIQSRLMTTDWWKERNETQRSLEALKATDPGSYYQQVTGLAKEIRGHYIELGYSPPGGDPFGQIDTSSPLFTQAETYLLTGMTSAEIKQTVQRAAAAGVQFDPLDPTPPGQMGNMMASIQQSASNYMVTVTEAQAYEWAQKIAMGDLTAEAINDTLRDKAISKFSFDANVVKRIQDGFTPAQLFSEHRNVIAQTLDLDPDIIDFNDPKYSIILNGGMGGASMSVAEARKYIRGSSDGAKSRDVQRDGNAVLQSLMQTFGAQK